MAARKLQQEIDRVFKRVTEGVAIFDALYEKMEQSTNQSQKEKLEQDLKREIKKLQRLRDQIKTWLGSNDIKDKKQLLEYRRLIETEMERFKACEREMKTKAYSKEGLSSVKSDPREKEKADTCNFVQEQLDELERQVETLESEAEAVSSTMKKGKKDTAKTERLNDIEHHLERHRWHMEKLEQIMRMVDNGQLGTDVVNDLREDIEYYIESNQDVDFAEDEAIYDELKLDEIDETAPELEYEEESNSLEDLAANHEPSPTSQVVAASQISNTPRKPQATTPSATPASSHAQTATSATATAAGAVAAAAAGAATPTPKKEKPIPVGLNPLPAPKEPVKQTATTPAPWAAASSSSSSAHDENAGNVNTASSTAVSVGTAASTNNNVPTAGNNANKKSAAPSPVPTPPPAPAQPTSLPTTINPEIPAAPSVTLPPGLQDLVNSFDAARKRIGNPPAITTIAKLLGTAYMNCPDSALADKPHYYQPDTPFPTPTYYPHEPIQGLDTEDILGKMDVDTLFYMFYYRQGTYQQYVAAKELKKRSWRFHKQFLTWFQRHEEPQSITNEHEQGTYRYFDFQGLWLQRRKSNFMFEYQFLEDEI